MELWDGYRKDGSMAGCDLVRDEPIPDGLFHLVSEVLVQHTDGSYLLMQRDFNKKGYPGMYEATAGGSIIKGETPKDGAVRELKEETGITAKQLAQIYYTVDQQSQTIYHGYLCITDCDKTAVTLQEGETVAYRWLDRKEFLEFLDSEEYIQAHKSRLAPYLDKIQ